VYTHACLQNSARAWTRDSAAARAKNPLRIQFEYSDQFQLRADLPPSLDTLRNFCDLAQRSISSVGTTDNGNGASYSTVVLSCKDGITQCCTLACALLLTQGLSVGKALELFCAQRLRSGVCQICPRVMRRGSSSSSLLLC